MIKEELIFRWGYEGGGSKVFRIKEKSETRIIEFSSRVDFEDIDVWHQDKKEYPSFDCLWEEAVKNDKWFRLSPVFIHDDVKPTIIKSFDDIDKTSLTEHEKLSIESWSELLFTYPGINDWQKNRYAFMARYNRQEGITDFGVSKAGRRYHHLLKDTDSNRRHNFLNIPEILEEVKHRHEDHKLGDYPRLLTNTVASQPCCFNLFVPLRNNTELASKLFSKLMGKQVEVKHIELEFTPYKDSKDDRKLKDFEFKGDETLGDQSEFAGTDADVAVFYTYSEQKRGVILIEFKYIEAEFSVCSSFKKKKLVQNICSNHGFYQKLIEPYLTNSLENPLCGYLKYENWKLLNKSSVFDLESIKTADYCPFRYSLQQLWRNMLLAQNVKEIRGLDEFFFWVLYPEQNKALWNQKGKTSVEDCFRKKITLAGDKCFARKELKKDFVDNLMALVSQENEKEWMKKFEERYLSEVD